MNGKIEVNVCALEPASIVFVSYPPSLPPVEVEELRAALVSTIHLRYNKEFILLPFQVEIQSVRKVDAKWLADEILAKLELGKN